MMKKVLMICTLSLGLAGTAIADEIKVVCSIENDLTKEVLASDEAPLSVKFNEQSFVLETNFGKYGKAILKGYGSLNEIPEMNKIFVSVSTKLLVPKIDMSVSDFSMVELGKNYGDIASSGSLITLGKDVYRFGCEIQKQ
jgi:hypothetical protein